MAGRKPTPTAMKLLAGNPGKRPLNRREPKPTLGVPPCPKWLSLEARKEWRWVVKELAQAGVLARIDRTMLAVYCHLVAEFVQAAAKGESVIPSKVAQIRALASEFGLTPSSRARLSTLPQDEGKDPFEDIINANRRN